VVEANINIGAIVVAQAIVYPPSKCEAPSANPSTAKKKFAFHESSPTDEEVYFY
jgi:hypothetical protein